MLRKKIETTQMNYMCGRLKYLFNIMNFGQMKKTKNLFHIYSCTEQSK